MPVRYSPLESAASRGFINFIVLLTALGGISAGIGLLVHYSSSPSSSSVAQVIPSSSSSSSSSSSTGSPSPVVPCSGLPDSTTCLNNLFQHSHQITFPPNQAVLKVNGSLFMLPNTYFNGNGATIRFANPNWFSYSCGITIRSNSTISNVQVYLALSVPYLGFCVESFSVNVDMGNLVMGADTPSIAIALWNAVRNISIHDSFLHSVSYGVYISDSSTTVNEDVQSIQIYNNVFFNNTAEGVIINQPVMYDQPDQGSGFDPWLVPFNIVINNNTFSNINVTNDYLAAGFCLSVAGGKQINITNNIFSGCTWQAIHLEDTAGIILIANNTIDWVYSYPNSTHWVGLIDGIWMANVENVTITNNTFSRIPNNAIDLDATGTTTKAANNASIPMPYQYSNGFVITQNTFVSWSGYAVKLGDVPGQNINAYVAGNTYYPNSIGIPFYCQYPLGITFLDNVGSSCAPQTFTSTANLRSSFIAYLPLISSYENMITGVNATYSPGQSTTCPPRFAPVVMPNGVSRTAFDNPCWIHNRYIQADVRATLNYTFSLWLQYNLTGQSYPSIVALDPSNNFNPSSSDQLQMFSAVSMLIHGVYLPSATIPNTAAWNLVTVSYTDVARTMMICVNATCTTTANTAYANWNTSSPYGLWTLMSSTEAYSGLIYNARFFNTSVTPQDVFNLFYLDTHSSICDSPSICPAGTVCITNGLSSNTYVCNPY